MVIFILFFSLEYNMNILCLIPARSGSKGLKDKNIKMLGGKPLLVWSIEQAKKCKYNMKIVVSTDSEEYRKIAIKYGAEVPFLRPKSISQDLSTDKQFIKHAVTWLKENENYESDFIVQLRPTYPTRDIKILNDCIKIFIEKRDRFDSLRTVIPFTKSPYKMYRIEQNKEGEDNLKPLFSYLNLGDYIIPEPFNRCRQELPTTYLHNGYIDILNSSLLEDYSISGENIIPYVMSGNEYHDIDTENDFKIVEKLLKIKKK